jgi:D-glycero-D-manno-heptose 1,7-bisphosphate phosphatase
VSGRPAVFLDRDGTLIEDRHYLRDPDQVHLLPGASEAVRRLNVAAIPAVVVTNQSGIARGLLTEADYAATVRRLDELLATAGARLDGHYHCPHLPDVTGPCDCRKPGPLLYERAARDLDLDLAASWWVGDRERDLGAADRFGGRAILVLTGAGVDESRQPRDVPRPVAADLAAAVTRILDAGPERGVE